MRDNALFGERRASAMPSPTIAASTEPSSVARMVIFTPWISVGMISQTKFQSHSIRLAITPSRPRAMRRSSERTPQEMTSASDEIEDQDGGERHQRVAGLRAHDLRLEGQVGERDQRHDGGRLEQFDGVVAEGRQHDQQRLRQDDVAHALPAAEIERDAGLVLLAADRLDGAAHHFGRIGADIEAQRQHAGLQRRQRDAGKGQHEIGEEQLHEDRRAAEEFDIGGGQPRSAKKRDTRPMPGEEGHDQRQHRPHQRQLDGDKRSLQYQAEIAGPLGH